MEQRTQGTEIDELERIIDLNPPRKARPFIEILEAAGEPIPPEAPEPQRTEAVETPAVAEDAINPSHYRKHPSGIECIEVTRHMNFNTGNAIKYIWRYLDKGDPIENLKKAQWYLDDEIRRLEGKR